MFVIMAMPNNYVSDWYPTFVIVASKQPVSIVLFYSTPAKQIALSISSMFKMSIFHNFLQKAVHTYASIDRANTSLTSVPSFHTDESMDVNPLEDSTGCKEVTVL